MSRYILYIFTLLIFTATSNIYASDVKALSKTLFDVRNSSGYHRVDLSGREFIVVCVREKNSDGRFYAVDRDGMVWLTGPVTSGAEGYETPSGIYPVLRKKRFHMSTLYPSDDGVNNMDYSIFFTDDGHALHKGSVQWMSHGCIHIDPKQIATLYEWAKPGVTKIVIMRGSYMPFARNDLLMFGLR